MINIGRINPAIVPLAISGAYLMNNHSDAYASALQLMLLSSITDILSALGLKNIIWVFMIPVVVLSAIGPFMTHFGELVLST